MFALQSAENIKNEIIRDNTKIMNFQKSCNFPFDDSYREIVTKIKTTEISSECTLYNSVKAENTTKQFSDKSYWNENITEEEIRKYWIIGQNGQGDFWIMGANSKIYFYDHENEQMSPEKFIDLNINFEQWLQFAYLNKELDIIYDKGKCSREILKEYLEKLKEISKELMKNYPFTME